MVNVRSNGMIIVNKEVMLSSDDVKKLLVKMVAGESGEFTGEWIHNRWSTLYNGFDMVFGTDVRSEHDAYSMVANKKISRLDFMVRTNRIQQFMVIASKLYPNEFQKYIIEYV